MEPNMKVEEDRVVFLTRPEKLTGKRIGTVMLFLIVVYGIYKVHPQDFLSPTNVIIVLLLALLDGWEIYRTFQLKPLCVISREGIDENITIFGVGWIGWDEIKELKIYKSAGIEFIGVILTDPQAFTSKLGFFQKMYLKLNLLLKYPPVNFYPVPLGLKAEELLKHIEDFRKIGVA